MYFVDRELIEERLIYLEKQIQQFEGTNEWNTALEQAALERLTQMMIESILDVGNAMIDGFIMRDPGSYEDIIDILEDELVISSDMSQDLKVMVQYRKTLVQDYTRIDHDDVKNTFSRVLPSIKLVADSVRQYLTNELGPVTAFKN
ncbi:type VII toxin-antitoxin system HepT family RNase toxin [Robertmurraya sp. FSL R5-0851]|uniref:type VII toxin-antitoxin system HepT family RNase toxin n=1 Tax=Robertmurraya sp. FSL R5-0851 TaxID=2921584 RepID=UPI0030F8389A